jgi:1A family penicillin-binding protein
MKWFRYIRRWFRRLPAWLEFVVLGFLALILIGIGSILIWAAFVPIPSLNNFENRQVAQSTKIYDRTGNIVLYDVHGSVRRTSVQLDQISPYIQNATIAIEDASFYQNAGFRPLSFLRAVMVDLFSGSYAEGGSTITQQVVKNALLTQDKTIARKIEEIILALRLTKVYTKSQILNTYLNETSYGGTIYGVQEASQYFFGVDAKDVDLAQAAYLAALPQAPTFYSPYGNNRKALDSRKNLVLERMKENGFITADEYNQAIAEQVQFKNENDAGIKAPHFVFYIREYLEQKYGADAVANGGLHVVTTLDYDLQQKAEAVVTKDAPGMENNFNASNTGVVAIDPKSGQVLAMVGSKDYFDDSIDGQVNVTLANRQPGSTFKPFVYATAFEKGYTPSTVVFDLPTQFSTSCSPQDTTNNAPPCFAPSNFSGSFKGPMTLRNAIAQSENVPSVKTLYLAGINDSLKTAQDLGISTLAGADRYGLTLVLGGGEVNLLEMTSAYGVFANDGVRNPPTGILEVTDQNGNVLESYQQQPTQVLDPQIAREVNDVLSDNVARTPEFGADGPLQFNGWDVADKTGTTDNSKDAWVIGYTPDIVVGEWAGNNNNTPMVKKIAAFIVAPTWHQIMLDALQKYASPTDTFPTPAPQTGSLPPVLTGNWNTDPSQGIHDILYWVNKDNPLSGKPANPASDPQFAYWDYPVQVWAQQNPGSIGGASVTAPTSPSSATSPAASTLQITSPQAGTSIPYGLPITLASSDQGTTPIASVSYYINGSLAGSSAHAPFTVTFNPGTHGVETLRAVGTHPDGTTEETTITFTVQ